MLQLAVNHEVGSFRRMATSEPTKLQLGRALKALRERKRMTLGQVGAALEPSISSQAWQKYEAGERHFTDDKIAAALEALSATREDLDAELTEVKGGKPVRWSDPRPRAPEPRGMVIHIRGIARMGPTGPQVYDEPAEPRTIDLGQFFEADDDVMELAGESMKGWGDSGDFAVFNRKRWPRPGKPCVIETMKGELLCKFYVKQDGSTLFYTELFPVERTLTLPLTEIRGVYRVKAKLES